MPTLEHIAWFFFCSVLIINGLVVKYYPPKKLTWWGSGMKLPFATKTEETWKEDNRYASTFTVFFGVTTLVLYSLLTFAMKIDLGAFTLMWVVILLGGLTTTLTKAHINRHFDENGNRRME